MRKFLAGIGEFIIKAVIAVVVCFLLFVIIPLAHSLLGKEEYKKESVSGPRIVAEILRQPKKEEKKEVQRRTRQIRSPSGQKGMSGRMNFKFTPDLAIGGGDGVAVEQQGNMDAVVFNEGETDEDAIAVSTPVPQYPQRARELGIEGLLEAIIVIGTDGKVTSIDIVSSPHASFKTEALKVLKTWRFKPARNQGVPVMQKKKQVIEYKLDS
ncbi:MAG: energy transducer TonB [Chitinispirillaceae bacterium]|nr:energy transducer TonB [Chitinispirillaceae bacterium]